MTPQCHDVRLHTTSGDGQNKEVRREEGREEEKTGRRGQDWREEERKETRKEKRGEGMVGVEWSSVECRSLSGGEGWSALMTLDGMKGTRMDLSLTRLNH